MSDQVRPLPEDEEDDPSRADEILSRYDPDYAARRRRELGELADRLSEVEQTSGERRLAAMRAKEAQRLAALAQAAESRRRRERRQLLAVGFLAVLVIAAILFVSLAG